MDEERTPATEALYAQGLAQLRAAQWDAAVVSLSELRSLSDAYPDVDSLIAEALLKVEVERTLTPDGTAPPKKRLIFYPRFISAALALLLIGGILFYVFVQFFAPTPPVIAVAPPSNIALPTPAPTNTPLPTATSVPTATPLPTATSIPTPVPTAPLGPGALQVRMAAGQSLVRTIGNIEIILDASGSMSGQIEGRRKIDIAHDALASLVAKLPDTTNVALRAYGHRKGGDCGDVELLTPLAPLDRAALTARINGVKPAPKGMTPIGASLQQVAEDLKAAKGDVLVVLVSDGDETCNGDPAQVATQIHSSNPNIKFDVIGFNVGPEEWRARLSGIAQGGGGNYFDAADAVQLVDALQQAVALTYRVLDATGAEVYQGPLGTTTTLPAGRYTVEIKGASPLRLDNINVGGSTPTTVELHEEDGALKGAVVPAG